MNTLNLLYDILSPFPMQHPHQPRSLEIQRLHVLTSFNQVSLPDSLCLVLDKEFREFRDDCYYLVPDCRIPVRDNVSVYSPDDQERLIEQINDALNDPQAYVQGVLHFQKQLRHEDDLSEIAYEIENYFQNPVVFVDESFKAIACSPKQKTGCIPFDLFLNDEYPDPYFIQSGRNIAELTKNKLSTPHFSCFKPLEIPIISAPIMNNGQCIGGFSIFEQHRKLTQTEVHLVEYLMLLLSNKAVIQNMKTNNNLSGVLKQLLFQRGDALQETLLRAERFSLFSDKKYCLMNAMIPDRHHYTYEIFIQSVRRILKSAAYCVQDQSVYFLIEPQLIDQERLRLLNQLAEKEKTFLLINNFPVSLPDIGIACKTTLELSEYLKNRRCGCYLTLDYYPQLVLNHLSVNVNTAPAALPYYHCLELLRSYDRKHATDYYLTLSTFLQHFSGMNETAEALNIHRNTLIYRLRKIEEIAGFQLDSLQSKLNLLLIVEIYNTLHRI